MTIYSVNFTDSSKDTITVNPAEEQDSGVDIRLFGRAFQEYGEQLNEDLLHVLENFSCPESELSPGSPDTVLASNGALSEPIDGQLWFNSTVGNLYYWNDADELWIPLANRNDYAANWGQIADGEQLPQPVSASTGYVFEYSECIWSIAPASFAGYFDWMACTTDSSANVTMKYRYPGFTETVSGIANYLIIGIKGNQNNGIEPIPVPSPTPSVGAPVTPTPTPTVTATVTPTVTPTTTVTPTVTPSTGAPVTPTPTVTPTISESSTPAPSETPTPTPDPDVTPTSTPGPSVTPTISITPSITPTPTPTSSSVYDALSASWSGGNSNAVASHIVTSNCISNVAPGSSSDSVIMYVTGGSGDYTITVDENGGAGNCLGSGSGNSNTTTTYSIGVDSLTLTAGISWNGACTDRTRDLSIDITVTDNVTSNEVTLSGTAFAQVYIGVSGGSNCP